MKRRISWWRRGRRAAAILVLLLGASLPDATVRSAASATLEADLLIVGGGESGVAAAIQAARLGVRRVVLVNDIAWLGGQFSAEGVGAPDEWTMYRGKRANFPRSGLFLEVIRRIRAHNLKKYGIASPGNSFCASETIEAADAARIFEEMLEPYKDRVQVMRHYQPVKVETSDDRVRAVTFEKTDNPQDQLTVKARLTIDASDWGDVIRLSGAAYAAGVDLRSRFGEENAPAGPLAPEARNEMNPISYCLVLREAGRDATIAKPPGYDERGYFGTTGVTDKEFKQVGWTRIWRSTGPAFVDTAYPEGIYSGPSNPYTHRRLVDRRHNNLPVGTEKIFLNWPVQDYPVYNFPQAVAEALEKTEAGASKKNIVDMTTAQRRIVFADAKRHALSMLYHLQTTVHDKLGDYPESFRYMELSDEFGTPDRLPFKPYVREGLRLEALYMLREQDIKQRHKSPQGLEPDPTWARVMAEDNVFGFQFNIDFHPTRRQFLNDDPAGPWGIVQTANRNWSTSTDCAGFPVRGLVPVRMDGLLGASKNLGVSSIVSSALRLHGQMMLAGQAAATLAAVSLRDDMQPREIAGSRKRVRELQRLLVRPPREGEGVLLWPYFDVRPEDNFFESANLLAVRQIMPGEPGTLDFNPRQPVTRRELARAIARAVVSVAGERRYDFNGAPSFADVPATDADFAYIESLARWGAIHPGGRFEPDRVATWVDLHDALTRLKLSASVGLLEGPRRPKGTPLPLARFELANNLWAAIKALPERFPDATDYLKPGHDADGDSVVDLDDALPFDRDNDNLPDVLDPHDDRAEMKKP